MTILAINAGSSSLKFALYPVRDGVVQAATLSGMIEGLQAEHPPAQARTMADAAPVILSWRKDGAAEWQRTSLMPQAPPQADANAATGASPGGATDCWDLALQALQTVLQQASAGRELQAIAHRVVHGGEVYQQAVRVDAGVLQVLETLNSLAPLHQPHNLHGIRLMSRSFPHLPQIACFDTAFHATIPEEEHRFALPESLYRGGVRRYGFHGLSYQFLRDVLQRHSPRAQERVLMAHLGNGASLCAMQGGQSCATTMGFSALDGLMMGTRCGALDPGVLLHLLAQGKNAQDLQDLLYRQSGLLGVSGLSADMRTLRQSEDAQAKLAVRLFTHKVVRESGAMAACMGGLDVLAFTGGIGEHDQQLRFDVCQRLAFLGVKLDQARNCQIHGVEAMAVHAADSAVEIWVIATDEGRIAAQAAVDCSL